MKKSYYDEDTFKKEYPKRYRKWSASKGKLHAPSRVASGKDEGLYLKLKGHPTLHKARAADKRLGYKFYIKRTGDRKGRMYSFPKDKVVNRDEYRRI